MIDELIWTQGATSDLQEVYERLEERREGLGEEILTELDGKIGLLKLFPEMAKRYTRRVRRLLFSRRRDFGLFYAINGRRLIVVAVADLRQDPESIARLLKQRGV
ncbi:MAG: plasmid stabilization system protein ParE [Verrucomicrobiales bacterium]|jgi:plasmid stabilization system protein ParE